MDMGLNQKTAFVTGSTKGIGKAIAVELAREGVHVLVNGRNEEEVERTVREIKSEFPAASPQNAAADLVDPEQREALFRKHPQVDILVNNMGIYEVMQYEDVDDEVWDRYFRTNVLAANALTKFYLADWPHSYAVLMLPRLKGLRSAWTGEWYRRFFNHFETTKGTRPGAFRFCR